MSNSMSDDYFSFMSNKGREKHAASRDTAAVTHPGRVAAIGPVMPSDVIDFVDESRIEVTESFVSDTLIQRLFKRGGDA